LFSSIDDRHPWSLEQEFSHPESRAKNSELATDKQGRSQQSAGAGHRPAMQERTDPKDVEAERFCRELTQVLERGQDARSFDSLVIAAPPEFLGMLRKSLSQPVARCLLETVEKDYTLMQQKDLPGLLPVGQR
jgi:protein required for attachment to host cells